jgi:MerR family transcriptional regulator/heat shock protein HspR
LVKPARKGNRRFFSANDITWIGCIRTMIHEEGISIPGIKKLLRYAPCWEITDCPREVCEPCTAKVDIAVARSLRLAGDLEAEKKAKAKDVALREKETAKTGKKKLFH